MEAKLQLRVQRYGWDAAAPIYEEEWQQHLARAQIELLRISDLKSGDQVVETAAGTGLVTFQAANAVGPDGLIIATDISGEMVNSGNAAAEKLKLSNVMFKRMNAENLEFENDSFDNALCALGLMYMPDPGVALAEMQRVLKPGGRICVAVWGERQNCGWAEIFPIVDARVNSEVCPLFFGLGAPGALLSALHTAGFSDLYEQRIQSTMSFPNSQRLLSAIIDGGAVALAAKRFDTTTRLAVDNEFLASVVDYKHGNGYEIPGEFVVATGIK